MAVDSIAYSLTVGFWSGRRKDRKDKKDRKDRKDRKERPDLT